MTEPTPTARGQKLRHGDFDTLCEALDYAAGGNTGLNYFDGKANLKTALTYREIREKAMDLAKRLVLFAEKDARIGIAAVSTPEFAILFFACQYAGLVPAPLPLPVTLGGDPPMSVSWSAWRIQVISTRYSVRRLWNRS
ncbi:AMP-binding protein [Litorimonas sp. RW-G-Af-16]|uniref:AMP-binding protein n=1 Tax=Litorimonas sp. RW-G-Af-16 TaxID=3241168 RepID=UPI003AAA87F1